MKVLKLIGILLLVNISNSMLGQKYYAYEFSKIIKKELRFSNPQTQNLFVIENVNGTIDVEGYNGNTIQVSIQKTILSHEKSTLELGKNEIKIGLVEKANEIYFYLDAPETTFNKQDGSFSYGGNHDSYHRSKYNYELNYKVLIPKNTNVRIHNASGEFVSTKNLNCQNAEILNKSGHLYVENIQADKIIIGTLSGHVEANNLTAKKIDARTKSGHVELDNITGQTEAHTLSGNIDVAYAKNPNRSSSYTTISGNVSINFQTNLNANIDYEIKNSGNFYTNFNAPTPSKINSKPNHSHKNQCSSSNRQQIKSPFKIGQGGSDFYFATSSGNIYLNKI